MWIGEKVLCETVSRCIIGDLFLTEWGNYVAVIASMGIRDCIDYYQATLDRYNAR